ncbi:MAG: DUF3352 domain-containing protein [Pseudanabaenaceae cyanobacterium]
MANSNTKAGLLVVGVTVAAVGGVGAYLYFQQRGGLPTAADAPPAAIKFIPQQALAVATLSNDPTAWQKLDKFQSPELKKLVAQARQNVQKETLQNLPFDWEKDAAPWVGEVAIAVLPPARPQAQASKRPANKGNLLMVVNVRDRAAHQKFTETLAASTKVKAAAREYQGIAIQSYQPRTAGPSLQTALVEDFYLISAEPSTLERAIDAFKGKESLAASFPPSQLNLRTPLARLYIPDVTGTINNFQALNPDVPADSLANLQQVKSVEFGIGVDANGLRAQGITVYEPAQFAYTGNPAGSTMVSLFPKETFFLISGSDLNARWQLFLKQAGTDPNLTKAIDELRQNLKRSPLQLDLDQDVFGWMNGEFAFGAIASEKGLLSNVGAGPALMIQTRDRAKAEATIAKLDNFAKTNGATVKTKEIGGQKITEWSPPGAPIPIISHGWSQNDTWFITAEPLAETLAKKPSTPLASSDTFKALTGTLGKADGGYFFLDMPKAWSLLAKAVNPNVPAADRAQLETIMGSIRGIAAAASQPEKHINRFEVLLTLKTAAQP